MTDSPKILDSHASGPRPSARRHPVRHAVARGRIFLLAATLAAVACDSSPTEPEGPEGEVAAFVAAVNDHRQGVGCPRLQWSSAVATVAQGHSQDMVDRGYFAHTDPDGVTAANRLQNAGIAYSGMGENLANGFSTGASVLTAWLNSSGHRANIENCQFTLHGVGLVGTHWTHVFMRP